VQVNTVKLCPWRIPRQFIQTWMEDLASELKKRKLLPKGIQEITLVFVSSEKIQELNQQFRAKSKPTDILSFEGAEVGEWGELVLCGEVLDQQAIDHSLSRNQELGYMLIHGALHLLGYDHEKSTLKAKEMFALQDEIFAKLDKKHFS